MTNAAFEADVPEIRSNPTTVTTVSTPGTCRAISWILRATAIVRTCAAASGRITCMNTAPLSSSGTKPVGVKRSSPTIATITAPSTPTHDQRPARAVGCGIAIVVADPVEATVEPLEESGERSAAPLIRARAV